MNPTTIQRIMAEPGYYKGAIDGLLGDESEKARTAIEQNMAEVTRAAVSKMPETRRYTAAAQYILLNQGLYTGAIDGYVGNQTTGALLEWEHIKTFGKRLDLTPKQTDVYAPAKLASVWPTQTECTDFYGMPGPSVRGQLVTFTTPYELTLGFDPRTKTSRMTLHRRCYEAFEESMAAVLATYGIVDVRRLRLDVYDGGYYHRVMRGGSNWSMHAYGCAADFWAAKNGLTTRAPNAAFSKADYKPFLDCMESTGLISLGRAIGRDYMHFQAARLK